MCLSRREFLRWSALGLGGVLLAGCGAGAPPLPPNGNRPTQSGVGTAVGLTASVATKPGFEAFADQIKTLSDGRYLYVESNGMPAHPLMIGITSWQQQVPLPQPYKGDNAWRIPLNPILSDNPISAKTALYRGAIALAVNGVPIFNALNNRGDDAYLAGELDQWGGHAGRADDYHYHMAPLHLQELVGQANPIAYALDGFPIYGLTEPDGAPVTGLDEYNGHTNTAGEYHYHATTTYPYINGGLRGVVTMSGDQIEPQPRTIPIRPALEPLRGATITDFKTLSPTSYTLAYQLNNQTYAVNYHFEGATYTFEFVDAAGGVRTETYTQNG